MKKYKVIRVLDNKLLSEWASDFADEKYYEMNWGKPEHQKELTPRSVIHHDAIEAVEYQAPVDAVLDENGIEISPAIPEILAVEAVEAWVETIEATYETVPSEYIVEIKDITAEIEADNLKVETKRSDRVSRVDQLKKIDWNTIDTIAELKVIVRALVKEAIKDDE